ncbi:6-O-methylguanine DNA methyltransferase [bacterium]|nr:6-O-methylguanine DNA methyltransferase [bacterium]
MPKPSRRHAQLTDSFRERVKQAVRDIPRGETLSYGEVATEAGSPGAARAVGSIMKENLDPSVPCHRVIHADGSIGEYNRGGVPAKHALLRQEGAL